MLGSIVEGVCVGRSIGNSERECEMNNERRMESIRYEGLPYMTETAEDAEGEYTLM